MARMRLRAGVIAIIVLAVVCAGAWTISRSHHSGRAPLSQALELLPADTRVTSFTDWQRIRETLDTKAGDIDALVDGAFVRDLSARSILADASIQLQDTLGWSVDDLTWEAYGQATDGSVLILGLSDSLGIGDVEDGLEAAGYTEAGGIWSLEKFNAVLPGVDSALTNIAVSPGSRTLTLSSQKSYLRGVVKDQKARETLATVRAAREAAAPITGAPSALLEKDADACVSVSLAEQPEDVRTQARNAVAPLGSLASISYAGRAIYDAGGAQRIRFSLVFDSASEAASQLALREQLTSGPFIGRTGSIGEVLDLTSTGTDGATATMDFDFDRTRGSFMSSSGPILFAACEI